MLTLYQVAERLKVSYRTVFRYVQLGKIKAVKYGRQYKVTEEEYNRIVRDGF